MRIASGSLASDGVSGGNRLVSRDHIRSEDTIAEQHILRLHSRLEQVAKTIRVLASLDGFITFGPGHIGLRVVMHTAGGADKDRLTIAGRAIRESIKVIFHDHARLSLVALAGLTLHRGSPEQPQGSKGKLREVYIRVRDKFRLEHAIVVLSGGFQTQRVSDLHRQKPVRFVVAD